MLTLAVAVAAGVGAVCRYLIGLRLPSPRGTMVVNVSGSFVLGLVGGLADHHGLNRHLALVLGVGFSGGFTTLSTWAWESLDLALQGRLQHAAGNVILSFAFALLAAAAGLGLALVG